MGGWGKGFPRCRARVPAADHATQRVRGAPVAILVGWVAGTFRPFLVSGVGNKSRNACLHDLHAKFPNASERNPQRRSIECRQRLGGLLKYYSRAA
jgi:hypothetical protein